MNGGRWRHDRSGGGTRGRITLIRRPTDICGVQRRHFGAGCRLYMLKDLTSTCDGKRVDR